LGRDLSGWSWLLGNRDDTSIGVFRLGARLGRSEPIRSEHDKPHPTYSTPAFYARSICLALESGVALCKLASCRLGSATSHCSWDFARGGDTALDVFREALENRSPVSPTLAPTWISTPPRALPRGFLQGFLGWGVRLGRWLDHFFVLSFSALKRHLAVQDVIKPRTILVLSAKRLWLPFLWTWGGFQMNQRRTCWCLAIAPFRASTCLLFGHPPLFRKRKRLAVSYLSGVDGLLHGRRPSVCRDPLL